MTNDSGFNPAIWHLGLLCKHGHDHEGTGQSLRSLRNGRCYVCAHQYALTNAEAVKRKKLAYYYANQEFCKAQNRDTHHANREERKKQQRAYRLANAEAIKKRKKAYQLANADRLNEKARANYAVKIEACRAAARASYAANKTTYRLRSKAIRGKRKAQKNLLIIGSVTAKTLEQMLEKFNNECAYCGSTKNLSIDHFLPLHLGGSHTESNLVPACINCNSRKNKIDPFIWYKRQPFFSQKRWKFILKLLGKTQENYNQIPLL